MSWPCKVKVIKKEAHYWLIKEHRISLEIKLWKYLQRHIWTLLWCQRSRAFFMLHSGMKSCISLCSSSPGYWIRSKSGLVLTYIQALNRNSFIIPGLWWSSFREPSSANRVPRTEFRVPRTLSPFHSLVRIVISVPYPVTAWWLWWGRVDHFLHHLAAKLVR